MPELLHSCFGALHLWQNIIAVCYKYPGTLHLLVLSVHFSTNISAPAGVVINNSDFIEIFRYAAPADTLNTGTFDRKFLWFYCDFFTLGKLWDLCCSDRVTFSECTQSPGH